MQTHLKSETLQVKTEIQRNINNVIFLHIVRTCHSKLGNPAVETFFSLYSFLKKA